DERVGKLAVHGVGDRVLLVGPRKGQRQDVILVLDLDVLGHSSSPLGNLLCTLVSQRATMSISAALKPWVRRALSSTTSALVRTSAFLPAAVSHRREARPSSGSARFSTKPASTIRSASPLMPGGPRSSAAPASPIDTPSRLPSTNNKPLCAAVTPPAPICAATKRCSRRCATLSR